MSTKAVTWAFSQKIPTTPRFVLVCMAEYANTEWEAWPTNKNLSEKTGLTERSVRDAKKMLAESGLIVHAPDIHTQFGFRLMSEVEISDASKYQEKTNVKRNDVPKNGNSFPSEAESPSTFTERRSTETEFHDAGAESTSKKMERRSVPYIEGTVIEPPLTVIEPPVNHGARASSKNPSLEIDHPPLSTPADVLENREFLEFWVAYPRKDARRQAEKAWQKARKRASMSEIMDGLRRCVAVWPAHHSDPQFRFIQHPATWLNADGWASDPTHSAAAQERNSAPRTRSDEVRDTWANVPHIPGVS